MLIRPMMMGVVARLMGSAWNPAAKGASVVLSDNNYTVAQSPGNVGDSITYGTLGRSTGKFAFEIVAAVVDIVDVGVSLAGPTTGYPGDSANSVGYASDGSLLANNSLIGRYATYATGDRITVAVDFSAGTVTFYKNGTAIVARNIPNGMLYPAVDVKRNGDAATLRTGSDIQFLPSGFSPWG